MVELAPALLAGILAAQIAQLGFEARLLSSTAAMKSKVDAMWSSYRSGRQQ